MRLLVYGILLALLSAGCSTEKQSPVMTLDSLMTLDRNQLQETFGKDALLDTALTVMDVKIPYTFVFPNTPREVRLRYRDENRQKIIVLWTSVNADTTGFWRTRDGLRVGMRMREVESINGKPFAWEHIQKELMAAGLEEVVKSSNWQGGTLDQHADVFFEKDGLEGNTLTSDNELSRRINPRVAALFLRYEYLPTTFSVVLVPLEKDGNIFQIPYIVDTNPHQKNAAEQINEHVRQALHLKVFDEKTQSYVAADNPDFTWSTLQCRAFYDQYRVGIHYQGDYVSQGKSDFIDSYVYAWSETGAREPFDILPLQSLFSLEGYWQFMNAHWLPECYQRYAKNGCASVGETDEGPRERGCQCDDIEFGVRGKDVVLTLSTIVCGSCMEEPYSITLPLETLRPYMSDWAKETVFQKNFYELSPLEQADMISSELITSAPDYAFIRGTIEGYDTVTLEMELYLTEFEGDDIGQALVRGKVFGLTGGNPSDLEGTYGGDSLVVTLLHYEGTSPVLHFDFIEERTATSIMLGGSHFEGYIVDGTSRIPFNFMAMKTTNAESFLSRRGEAKWR